MADTITGTTSTSTTTPTRNGTSVGPGGRLGKNEFLQLLTTQLRFQDPMNPMDGHQLAADLAQFSGLEQLVNIESTLEGQKAQSDNILLAINNSVALSTIGKTVVAQGNEVALTKNDQGEVGGRVRADVAFSGLATLTIMDATGKEIASRSLGYQAAGVGKEFDVGSAAEGLKEGRYTYRIDVVDGKGKAQPQTTYTVGTIDGITYSENGAVLTSGPLTIAIGRIVKILA